MFHGMIPLNSVLLLLLVNFVSAFRLKLMYISLIVSIRSSLTDLALRNFSKLPILFSSTIPPLFNGPEGSSSASHLKFFAEKFSETLILMTQFISLPVFFLELI